MGCSWLSFRVFNFSKENIDVISKVKLTYPISTVAIKFISFLLDNSNIVSEYISNTVKERAAM